MKKVLSIVAIAAMSALVACGGDNAAAEQKRQDSIRMADSMKAIADAAAADSARMADSMANAMKAAAEQAKMDSTRIADSIAAAKKVGGSKPKPKPTPGTPAPLKVGKPRGGN